jgi:tetratricopeptide (TPR) repeat protein
MILPGILNVIAVVFGILSTAYWALFGASFLKTQWENYPLVKMFLADPQHLFVAAVFFSLVSGGSFLIKGYVTPRQSEPKASLASTVKIGQVKGGVVHTGTGHVVIMNIHGVSEETFQHLAEELGVTRAALKNFFEILEQKEVRPEELDSTLRKIAKRYSELYANLQRFSSDDRDVTALKHEASEALKEGDFDKAEHLLNRASARDIEMAEKFQEIAQKRLLSAAASKAENGNLKYTQLVYAESAAYFREAVELHPNDGDETLADYLTRLGMVLLDTGDFAEAEKPFIRALDILKKTLGSEHPDVAVNLNNLSVLYCRQGKYDKAELHCQRALEIQEKTLGSEHSDVATSLNNLAGLYVDQGKYEEAEPLSRRALQIMEKVLGPEHPYVAMSLNTLATVYWKQG